MLAKAFILTSPVGPIFGLLPALVSKRQPILLRLLGMSRVKRSLEPTNRFTDPTAPILILNHYPRDITSPLLSRDKRFIVPAVLGMVLSATSISLANKFYHDAQQRQLQAALEQQRRDFANHLEEARKIYEADQASRLYPGDLLDVVKHTGHSMEVVEPVTEPAVDLVTTGSSVSNNGSPHPIT